MINWNKDLNVFGIASCKGIDFPPFSFHWEAGKLGNQIVVTGEGINFYIEPTSQDGINPSILPNILDRMAHGIRSLTCVKDIQSNEHSRFVTSSFGFGDSNLVIVDESELLNGLVSKSCLMLDLNFQLGPKARIGSVETMIMYIMNFLTRNHSTNILLEDLILGVRKDGCTFAETTIRQAIRETVAATCLGSAKGIVVRLIEPTSRQKKCSAVRLVLPTEARAIGLFSLIAKNPNSTLKQLLTKNNAN